MWDLRGVEAVLEDGCVAARGCQLVHRRLHLALDLRARRKGFG